MSKTCLASLVLALFVSGCNSNNKKNDPEEENPVALREELVIQTKSITNKEGGEYSIYFLHVAERNEEPGAANQWALGPFEVDENGKCIVDLSTNFQLDIKTYLENWTGGNKNKLELFIVTKEDHYIRNPLNEKTIVEFGANSSSDPYSEPPYYAKENDLEVTFYDTFPDGVLSLTFPDATFVIKLEFEIENKHKAYEVSIHWDDSSHAGEIGIIRVGRISREFQYWDTPFFKSDNLAGKSGKIVIVDFDTDERIPYLGYPKTV